MKGQRLRHHASHAAMVGTVVLSFVLMILVFVYFATTQQPAVGKASANDQSFKTNVGMTYPTNWAYRHTTTSANGAIASDDTTLTSPSGAITVTMSVFKGTVEGPCSNDQTKLVYLNREPVSGYPEVNLLSYIESFRETPSSNLTYSYFIGVADNDDEDVQKTTLASNTACELNYAGMLNLDDVQKGENKPIIMASLTFNNLGNATVTPDIIQSQMKGAEFEQAKTILESFTNKE